MDLILDLTSSGQDLNSKNWNQGPKNETDSLIGTNLKRKWDLKTEEIFKTQVTGETN